MPWRRAVDFTGDGRSSCLRPLGRSGCVTTVDTVWPAAMMRSRVGTANSGVPRKIRRMGTLLPFAGLLQLFDFALDQVTLEGAQVIDEQDSVQVIDLVEKRAGQQVFAAHFEPFAFGFL